MNTQRKQSGIMLIEVLIGMLLFLIGIVGLISLQAMSVKSTVDAKYRTEASYLANQIIGRMWSDPANLNAYSLTGTASCPSTPNSEIDKWVCNVKNTLPNASGANSPLITISGTRVMVQVFWQKDLTNASDRHEHRIVTDISPS